MLNPPPQTKRRTMTIPQLNELQVDAVTAAANLGSLIQILPNPELDKSEVYEVWAGRIAQVAHLVELGLIKEMPTDKDQLVEQLKIQYPGRTFRIYEPTKEAIAMFGNGSGKRTIN